MTGDEMADLDERYRGTFGEMPPLMLARGRPLSEEDFYTELEGVRPPPDADIGPALEAREGTRPSESQRAGNVTVNIATDILI